MHSRTIVCKNSAFFEITVSFKAGKYVHDRSTYKMLALRINIDSNCKCRKLSRMHTLTFMRYYNYTFKEVRFVYKNKLVW